MTRNVDPDLIEVKVPKSVKEILEEGGIETEGVFFFFGGGVF